MLLICLLPCIFSTFRHVVTSWDSRAKMKGSTSFISSLLFSTLAHAAAIPTYFHQSAFTRRSLSAEEVRQELGSQVSNSTLIYGPDDPRYANATARWNDFAVPQIQVVIVPGAEDDVSTIVKYCNQNSLAFLAINRGHGNAKSLGTFNGVQINMAHFKNIDIQPDGKSAWFGGGTYDGQVSEYLWQRGYVATTGSCDCVGMMGPGLGGGLGRHGGVYGLISDNIIQLNIVLANGDAIRVNSTHYNDLLWGMKGAGHNFGIVTSFELHIYPRGPDTWHYHNYVWRGDKLEAVFKALNDFAGNNSTPINMTTNFGSFFMNTTITTTEPVIWWTFAYRGCAEEAEALLAPFNAIEAAYDEQDDVPYPTIAVAQQTDVNSYICQEGSYRITTTSFLQTFNITAEREIFDTFQQTLDNNAELGAGINVLHEGYSTEGVQSFPDEDSAYPWRQDVHLNLVQIVVDPDNKTLHHQAWDFAKHVRDLWNQGEPNQQPDVYVNYANGFESLHEIYGHEEWRLERLKGLKATYDPENRFQYYNPIVVPSTGNGTRS